MILRELTSDISFGEPRGIETLADGSRRGINTMSYTEAEIRRTAGFRAARARRGKLCSVDKANVLETMELWRAIVTEDGAEYPDVELSHLVRVSRHGRPDGSLASIKITERRAAASRRAVAIPAAPAPTIATS